MTKNKLALLLMHKYLMAHFINREVELWLNNMGTPWKHIANMQKTKNAFNPSTPKPKKIKLNPMNACQAFIGYMTFLSPKIVCHHKTLLLA